MKPEIEAQFRAEARTAYLESLALLTLPEASNPAKWALEKRRIGQGASPLAKNGDIPYTFEKFPYAREPLESTVDPDVETSVWVYASGLGKTEQFVNVLGYCVEVAPCNVMAVWPKDDTRDYNSQNVIQRSLIDATPSINALFHPAKSRDSGNTIEFKRFAGGSLLMRSARVAANFRGPRCGCAYAGEVDGMIDTTEGDPLELLWMRCVGFEDAIQIVEGTPTFKGHSRSWGYLLKSDFRKWFAGTRCGHRVVWMWKDMDWPKQGKNRHEKAVLLCPTCGRSHNNQQRSNSVESGIWKPTQEFGTIRGYWLNGLNSLLPAKKGFHGNNLYQFAADASRAAHSNNRKEAVQVWTNTFLAEPNEAEEADAKQDWRKLYDRREAYPVDGRMPQGVIILESGTDTQVDRVEAEIVGYGKDEESWGIENAVFFGDPRTLEIWLRVDAWLSRVHIREDGARLTVRGAGFDTGYAAALRMLYEYIRPRQHRNYHALKGASLIDAPYVTRSKASKVDRVSLKLVGTHRIKDLLYDRALLETPGPGYMHFPGIVQSGNETGKATGEVAGYDEEWFKQFLSETPYPIYKAGVRLRQFKHEKINETLERNEKLDIRVYGLAALYLRGPINWEAEERVNLSTIPPPGTSATAAQPVIRPVSRIRRTEGFL